MGYYLSKGVPWNKRSSRRIKTTYKQYSELSRDLQDMFSLKELDPKYEAKMDQLEREWYAKQEQMVALEQIDLFNIPVHPELSNSQLDAALKNINKGAGK